MRCATWPSIIGDAELQLCCAWEASREQISCSSYKDERNVNKKPFVLQQVAHSYMERYTLNHRELRPLTNTRVERQCSEGK